MEWKGYGYDSTNNLKLSYGSMPSLWCNWPAEACGMGLFHTQDSDNIYISTCGKMR